MASAMVHNGLMGPTAAENSGHGFLSSFVSGLMAVREKEARRVIAMHLAGTPGDRFLRTGVGARDAELLRHSRHADLAG